MSEIEGTRIEAQCEDAPLIPQDAKADQPSGEVNVECHKQDNISNKSPEDVSSQEACSGITQITNPALVEGRENRLSIDQAGDQANPRNIDSSGDDVDEDGFVSVAGPSSREFANLNTNRILPQLVTRLENQLLKLEHYKKVFTQQGDDSWVEKFENLIGRTTQDLELLRKCHEDNQVPPKHSYEYVEFDAMPVNPDVKDKELKIAVRAKNLQSSELESIDKQIYVIAEFGFPMPSGGGFLECLARALRQFFIRPSTICPGSNRACQVDKAYSINTVTLEEPTSSYIQFEPNLTLYIDKGKSKTHKRKFKPIKLTFWQKRCLYDKMIGTLQFKVDDVNDISTLVIRSQMKKKLRTQPDTPVDIQVKVREPLVEKNARPIKEKILFLNSLD